MSQHWSASRAATRSERHDSRIHFFKARLPHGRNRRQISGEKAEKEEMSQCVPNWDLDGKLHHHHHHSPLSSSAATATATSAYYDVTELTWNNHVGHLTTLPHTKPSGAAATSISAVSGGGGGGGGGGAGGGTLECIVDQVRSGPHQNASDAMVPCSHVCERNCTSEGSTTPVAAAAAVAEKRKKKPSVSASSAGNEEVEGKSLGVDQLHSLSHALRSQRDGLGDRGIASTSAKRGREAAVHNQSERKRRDRINEKMKTLQKLLPNSTKTDKASMLDEVIDYLKLLQGQVQMMRRMNSIPTMMMLPIAMQHQQLQLAMMAQMTQMGMSLGMINPSLLSSAPPPPILHPPTFLPRPSTTADGRDARATEWMQQPGHRVLPDMVPAFMGCPTQQQAVSSEAYSRLAALYQQLYQQPLGSNQKT